MNGRQLSRRSFLGGALSFGALAGCNVFRAPAGVMAGDGARLVLGVISDIHIDAAKGDFKKFGDTEQFEKTLRWFDEQGVDGVVLAGDMADNGMMNQLERVGEAWFRVFPDGTSRRDGRPVEQLFVYGNHDLEGQHYDKFGDRYFEKTSFEAAQICRDPAAAWKQVFREKYAPIWLKTVKGYQFVGAHWDSWSGVPAVEDWFRNNAGRIDRTKPFFFIQHCHPRGTVYGDEAWGADKGYATRALSAFPNAVAFTGHSHESLTDERSVWQGDFTSIGTASLRYGGHVNQYEQRQGMLVSVYDDRIVLARRDFLHDESLGDDWVIPLPCGQKKPYDFAARKAAGIPPKFGRFARLSSQLIKGKGWKLTIPCADAGKTRPFRYEVATGCEDKDGKPVVFTVYDAKYNMPLGLSGAATRFLVKFADLPGAGAGGQKAPTFTVTPLDWFGNRGLPLSIAADS